AYTQVGIGTVTPAAGSILDIESDDKGILIPRVALIATNNAAPITPAPVEGLMVYNIATAGTTPNIVTPGFYFWNGIVWTRVATGGAVTRDWAVTGNGDINATDFIGTTNVESLRFRTNNLQRMLVLANGQVSINENNPFTGNRFTVLGNNGEYAINGYSDAGVAIYGNNTGSGRGVFGSSNNIGVEGFGGIGIIGTSPIANGQGIRAINTAVTGTGLLSVGNNSPSYILDAGSGAALNGAPFGAVAYGNRAADGYGIIAAGNALSAFTIPGGGGGSFTGRQWGVFANATISGASNNATNRAAFAGNFISNDATLGGVYIGARIGGNVYKILGTGGGAGASVSTTMPTRDGERILFAPEAPENWFFDLGEAQLINGKATVNIDPLFIDVISDAKPFKVFVQGAEETIGSIRVSRNQREKSFTLEDSGGPSNGVVQFKIYGIWKGKENLRFPEFLPEYHINPEYLEKIEVKEENILTQDKGKFQRKN
nr:hypothetical protein [Flavobacteriales bacterium]